MNNKYEKKKNSAILPFGRVSVLLPIPVYKYYDYLNEDLSLQVGDFVEVPFGKRCLPALVMGVGNGDIVSTKLKPVLSRFDCRALPKEMMDFMIWVSAYNMAPAGAILKMVLSAPDALQPLRPIPVFFKISNKDIQTLRITKSRTRVLDYLSDCKSRTLQEITRSTSVSSVVVKGLHGLGLLGVSSVNQKQTSAIEVAKEPIVPILNREQVEGVEELIGSVNEGTFNVCLIDGVTGSGKTEVYFEAIAAVLRMKRQVLVLVPEIALSQPLLHRFEARFGFKPTQWHSDLSTAVRRQNWRAVAEGDVAVIIGARSALFLPFLNLGLIVVDEEHEAAFKQTEGIKYQCRDMAVVRARTAQISTVLVSATPSLESLTNFELGRYKRISLSSRYGTAQLPEVHAIDVGKEKIGRGKWIADKLVHEISETLKRGEQVILFLNRRGYAPLNLCRSCGHKLECTNCSAWLVEHKAKSRLQCHHCDYRIRFDPNCIKCGGTDTLAPIGPGVERLEEEVRSRFPTASVLVASSDTLSGPKSLEKFISAVKEVKVDIIIGTQVIAKGYHFPMVTCVGVIDADLGMAGGDLRAGERTYQLLHQVAGRAGREIRPGRVWVQTLQPEHPLIKALINWDRDGFLQEEKNGRVEAGMPPFGKLVALIISSKDESLVDNLARLVAASAPFLADLQILGPAPAPIAILRGRHRRRFLVKGPKSINMQKIIKIWLQKIKIPSKAKLEIDIDPYSFM